MRYYELNEARRNPQQNPKENVFDILEKYNNSGYYMSYTAIDKIGLNPRSGYNTPIGIYSYPIISDVVDTIINSQNMSRVPYMGEAPYIWIFKPKTPDNGLIIGNYSFDEYDSDAAKLFKYINKKDAKIAGRFDEIKEYAETNARKNTLSGNIWNLTRILARLLTGSESLTFISGIVLSIGDKVMEINTSLIAEIIDVYHDEKEYKIEYPSGYTSIVKFDEVEYIENKNESIITEYQKDSKSANSDAVMWTYLLHNVLGYDYVDDSAGTGLIHLNELVQAVFFNSGVINVVKKINNPNAEKDEANTYVIFSSNKSVEEVEKIDQSIIQTLFKKLLKNKVSNIAYQIPPKFMGHIVVNSSKLQAQLLLNDGNFIDYFKSINRDTIRIMDDYMIKKIGNMPSVNIEYDSHLRPLFDYFNRFHKGIWPEGERAILNKAYNDNNAVLILEYCYRVRKTPWPEAEFIILKKPSSIPTYAEKILKRRWPEGEQVLSKIDPQRGEWILDMYAQDFNIKIEDIGKI